MPTIEFVGQSSQDPDNKPANTSRLLNLYRETVSGRTARVLKSVLGMQEFSQLDAVFMRAMHEVRGVLYVVAGGNLFSIASTSTATLLGTIPDSPATTISSNNGKVTIVANGNYYIWDGETLERVTAVTLSEQDDENNTYGFASDADIVDVTFIGQRSVIVYADRVVQWSDVTQPALLDALNFASTESRDDNNLRAAPIGGALWVFKEQSIERWQQNATGLLPIANYTIDRGLKARNLLVEVPQGVFFIGNDGRAYIGAAQGLGTPISNRAVETSIETQSATNVFYYADEGHEFYVIRFSDRPAWCFDLAAGEWHERSEGAHFKAWSAVNAAAAFDGFYVGTETGGVHKLARTNQDIDAPLYRRAVSRSLRMEGNRFVVRSLEFLGRVGRSLLNNATRQPAKIMMRVSRDYGQTWGAPKVRSMGDQGDYDQRMVFRSLGQARSFTVDVTISDPADLTLDAEATIEAG